MATNEVVQKWFLVCISSVYLIAFVSIFVQLPGLYGDNGILPVRLALNKGLKTTTDILNKQPTLLHFLARNGFTSADLNLNLITLLGAIVAFASFVSDRCRTVWAYALLFILYQSIVQVGQTFLWFQWDTLLLEVGLLTLLVAPLRLPFIDMDGATKHSRSVAFWLVKWLAFRLMFCSGVVKLNSQCPTWWSLTALTYHYASQCIPTPLSWYFHHLPIPFHRFSNAMVFLIQIGSSIFFFSPLQLHTRLSFVAHTLLMLLIMFTGNYNFFNFISIFLLLSLLRDPAKSHADSKPQGCVVGGVICQSLSWLRPLIHIGSLVYVAGVAYSCYGIHISTHPPYLHADIQFTLQEFHDWIHSYVPITIWVASISLAVTIATALLRSLYTEKGLMRKVCSLSMTTFTSAITIIIFATSLVAYTEIDKGIQSKLPRQLFKWHHNVNQYNVINSYGLFRSMTGVGGRPEVVVEGQSEVGGAWKEYEFLYKPGSLDRMPPVVEPHQPRLDWQMWFAALGSYQHNPWFLNLIYRLLHNQPEVLALMDTNPFHDHPPSSIRAHLYHYHFTAHQANTSNWWRREWVREYLPELSLDNEHLVQYVKESAIESGSKGFGQRHDGCLATIFINYLHAITPPRYAFQICISVLLVGLSSILLDRRQATNEN